jgi:4-methylaminobutanoate oxidase (formaldehyde-forming)
MVHLKLNHPEPILLHDEPIWRNGEIAGRTTSGAYGHFVGASVALGYLENVPLLSWQDWIDRGSYEIEIAGTRHSATVSRQSFHDPQNRRIRS